MSKNFEGFISGKVYDVVAAVSGYGPDYYRRAAMAVPVRPGMRLADLGCGTASLSLALAARMEGRGHILGVDISEPQLARARDKVRSSSLPIDLHRGSVARIPCDDDSLDGICMSQVLHALPENLRGDILVEAVRTLKRGGFFALLDWSRPRVGYTAAIWTPTLLGMRDSHSWRGTWAEIFRPHGFHLTTDVYLDSLNRCQVFTLAHFQ